MCILPSRAVPLDSLHQLEGILEPALRRSDAAKPLAELIVGHAISSSMSWRCHGARGKGRVMANHPERVLPRKALLNGRKRTSARWGERPEQRSHNPLVPRP